MKAIKTIFSRKALLLAAVGTIVAALVTLAPKMGG
jgi:hypothetical protein